MKKILIVDNEESLLGFYQKIFARMGCETKAFTDGNQALEELRENNYDILITDINNQSLSGIGLLKEAKKINENLKMYIISSSLTPEIIKYAKDIGCNDCIQKPFDINRLNEIVG